jgi:hypothetical protein
MAHAFDVLPASDRPLTQQTQNPFLVFNNCSRSGSPAMLLFNCNLLRILTFNNFLYLSFSHGKFYVKKKNGLV